MTFPQALGSLCADEWWVRPKDIPEERATLVIYATHPLIAAKEFMRGAPSAWASDPQQLVVVGCDGTRFEYDVEPFTQWRITTTHIEPPGDDAC